MKKFLVFLIIAGCIAGGLYYVAKIKVDNELKDAEKAATIDAYYKFVSAHKTASQCTEAAQQASLLIEKGDDMAQWPEFLATLGENKSGRPVVLLVKYLQYPIAEIRAGAAAGLLKLAADVPAEVQSELGDLNIVAVSAREDSDPRVRRDARCILWHLGKTDLLGDIKEFSPFVLEGFEAYKAKNPPNQRKE
jgi:hypothetical protein